VQVVVPQKLNGKAADALKAFQQALGAHNPREELLQRAKVS